MSNYYTVESLGKNHVNNDIIPLNDFLCLINDIYKSKEKEEKI